MSRSWAVSGLFDKSHAHPQIRGEDETNAVPRSRAESRRSVLRCPDADASQSSNCMKPTPRLRKMSAVRFRTWMDLSITKEVRIHARASQSHRASPFPHRGMSAPTPTYLEPCSPSQLRNINAIQHSKLRTDVAADEKASELLPATGLRQFWLIRHLAGRLSYNVRNGSQLYST